MFKYIIIILLSFGTLYSQDYKTILNDILSNNKEILAYKEYLNSLNIESKIGNLPQNPEVEYSYLSKSGSAEDSKQELIISQMFDFPTKYFLKSDIADLNSTSNEMKLKVFKREILRSAQKLLIEYIYQSKKIQELTNRMEAAESILKAIQTQFDNGDVGILELNKAKSAFSISESKLNMAKIELNLKESELNNMNGGKKSDINKIDYLIIEPFRNFDSLFAELKALDIQFQAFEKEKNLHEKKLSLAKSGWLPSLGIGYRQEIESGFDYKGVQLMMTIPVFENNNKVPKAESELNTIELKRESYELQYYLKKKRLYEQSKELKRLYDEQIAFTDLTQLDLNRKAYETGQISLTQYYIDNQIFYDITDSILEIEREYHKTINELLIELILDY